ncbi:MAG: glycoside hydrolase N-terminal domain-containing protein, partial [Deltaproteobacteria bacterium]
MKRRDFLKTSATAAGLMGSLEVSPMLTAAESDSPKAAEQKGAPLTDNRPTEYLRRAQGNPSLPKPPAPGRSYPVSPMPLAERVRRKIVPQRGFCSIAPGNLVSESLISGNGAMSIDLTGDPYSEQVLFHHESLLMPWKRPLEAPDDAELFPIVRQMVLIGRPDVMAFAAQRMNQGPIKMDTLPHLTVPAFLMQLDLPKNASVKDYLRTVDFESGELKVHWTDNRGDWVRRTFTSRPDNVVVQWLTAPTGQSVNARISLQKSAEWSMSSGMDWGHNPGIGAATGALIQKGAEAGDVRQDFNERRLIYKCILDP